MLRIRLKLFVVSLKSQFQNKVLFTVWRKSRSFLKLPFSSKVLVLLVWVLLGLARAIILLMPLRYFSAWLGQSAKTVTYTPILTPEQVYRAKRLGLVVRATANFTPWASVCFPQALVACLLLRLSATPYIMHFGLAKNIDPNEDEPMKAHAWVTAGSVSVTGGRNNLFKFTVVGSYTSPLLTNLLV